MIKIGLALSGGGARGVAHIAFLKAFDQLGIKPSIISGTSIGALIGALYASGKSAEDMESFFSKLTIRELTRYFDVTLKAKGGLLRGDKFTQRFRKEIGCEKFEELKIPLKVVATDFNLMKQVVFDKGDLIQPIRASIAIPGLFSPVNIDGKILIDGGAVNPLPYQIIREECDLLIAIDVVVERTSIPRMPNIFENTYGAFQISQKALIENQLRYSRPDIYVKPKISTIKVLEFTKAKKILKSVESEAELFKKQIKKRITQQYGFLPK